ncbi:MAG: hypothetical protein WBM96_02895, partial [Polyangiales bacterium]
LVHGQAVGLAIRDVEGGWAVDGAPVRSLSIEVAFAEITFAARETRDAKGRHQARKKGRTTTDAKHTSRKCV